jgi:hypothetical protein
LIRALLFRFLGLGRLFNNEHLGTLEFFLKTAREIACAVLEKDNKAEGEKDEQDEPKKPADQRHDPHRNLVELCGQRCISGPKVPIERPNETAMLLRHARAAA